MKTDELTALGLTEEQVKEVFRLNGKDIETERRKTEKAETDRDQWKARAETAEETLKGFDGVDVAKLNQDIEAWKTKAEEAEKDYQAKLYERDFSDTLKTELESIAFSSEAAKKAITAEIKAAGLKLKDGKILGLSDLIDQIKAQDASAFLSDKPKPEFTETPTTPQSNGTGFDKMSLAEKMAYANEHPTSADVVSWFKK